MKEIYDFLCKKEMLIAECSLGILSVLVFAAAVGRFLYHPMNWAMDVATFLFAWTVFLGADRHLYHGDRFLNILWAIVYPRKDMAVDIN